MAIQINGQLFHLTTKNTSYMMQIFKKGYLSHLYWGKKIHGPLGENLAYNYPGNASVGQPDLEDRSYNLCCLTQEYGMFGTTDYRQPAIELEFKDGSRVCDLRYESHIIHQGKPALEGLPSTYVEEGDKVETLEILLRDEFSNFAVSLFYAVYEDYDAITRWAVYHNDTNDTVQIERALSAQVDYADHDFDMIYLAGAWARERDVVREKVGRGLQLIESKQGSSGHAYNPFMALVRPDTNETSGDVFGFNFVYSGNFVAGTEVETYGTMRMQMGISPFDFKWELESKETFTTPEVVMVYAEDGLNGMSQRYHKLYKERLCRGQYRDQERPILINNWEATYFDFDHDKILGIATEAEKLGIEMLVLDDGWFGERNDDHRGLGDWYVNTNKLPKGIKGLAEDINKLGMKFGLWVEPEMVSPNSDLYRKHPDWCIHIKGRRRSEGRHQLVLDLSRQDVTDYIIDTLTDVFSSGNISYVKWDMNRFMTEIGSALLPASKQKEVPHRYMLNLYHIFEVLTAKFPHILFEGCASGGGRMDPGLLHYMPQFWTSDNTDAVERLKIQYGTSMVYPTTVMSAHVSECPNHQCERVTPLKMRGDVAMSTNFGYELDVTDMTDEEKQEVRQQVKWYKEHRKLIQFGNFYRLISPFEENYTAWMITDYEKEECLLYFYQTLCRANIGAKNVKLTGLVPDALYVDQETGKQYYGDVLMNMGLFVPNLKDFGSKVIHFKKSDL